MTSEYLPGGRQCAADGCDEAATITCDNCDRRVCDEHGHKFRGHYMGDTDQCNRCCDDVR
jgi:hypothetical protein